MVDCLDELFALVFPQELCDILMTYLQVFGLVLPLTSLHRFL